MQCSRHFAVEQNGMTGIASAATTAAAATATTAGAAAAPTTAAAASGGDGAALDVRSLLRNGYLTCFEEPEEEMVV